MDFQSGTFHNAHLVVDMNSMAQENTDLLHHLKSADFFDVEHYPTATIDLDHYTTQTVSGKLTIHGKSSPFQAPVQITPAGDHFIVTGKVNLDRTRYGIVYNSQSFFSGLGDKAIRNDFNVEFSIVTRGTLPPQFKQ